jgi:hypothetical protein
MRVFSMDPDNRLVVFASEQEVPEGASECFRNEQELAEVAQPWRTSRLIALWNQIPGVKPVTKFTDRKTAVRRIWAALQGNAGTVGERRRDVRSKRRGRDKPAGKGKRARLARTGTKTERILTLLRQPSGATLATLMRATQWQPHSVRGFLSAQVSKKMGLKLKSFERDGERVYAIKR